ncbi:hypothetical protein KY289_018804 [Solanum tuberosum]|nr:hypothetical protein KY289_018804 [Solanum tuberosum]
MGKIRILLLLVSVLFSALVACVDGFQVDEENEQKTQGEQWFLLRHLHNVVKTDAGSMRFVKGEAKVGHIYKDQLEERSLKPGDVYTIPAGSAFYLENRVESKRLQVICSIDITSESMGWHAFSLSSLVVEVIPPPFLLDSIILRYQLLLMFQQQKYTCSSGPIVHLSDVIERVNHKASSIDNLYNKKPDFKNDYGWSKKVDLSDYSPLEQSGNDGSLMAPHINPSAIEYGILLRGTGRIQIVYPNGILAMNAKSLRGPEFAAAFGIDEKRLKRIANAQRQQIKIKFKFKNDQDQAQSPWIQLEVKIKIKFKFKNDQDQDHWIQDQARSLWIQLEVKIKIKFKFKNDQDQDRRIQDQARSPWIQLEVKIKFKIKIKLKLE